MQDHWFPRWAARLPWWVKWAATGGVGLLTAFLPTVLDLPWQMACVIVGAILILIAIGGAGAHTINEKRAKRGKPRFTVGINFILLLLLLSAAGIVGWQIYRDNKYAHPTSELKLLRSELCISEGKLADLTRPHATWNGQFEIEISNMRPEFQEPWQGGATIWQKFYLRNKGDKDKKCLPFIERMAAIGGNGYLFAGKMNLKADGKGDGMPFQAQLVQSGGKTKFDLFEASELYGLAIPSERFAEMIKTGDLKDGFGPGEYKFTLGAFCDGVPNELADMTVTYKGGACVIVRNIIPK